MAERAPDLVLPGERARALMLAALTALGMPADQAATCADCFLFASLRGIDSHGIIVLFPTLARQLAEGQVRTDVAVSVEQETPATARLDGNFAAGAIIGRRAMELAMAKARQVGAGVVAAARCRHFGAASYYCCLAAEQGLIGLAMCDAYPNVAPYGGAAALHGTNPIAYAVPVEGGPPLVLDVATSVGALCQVTKERRRGQPIPPSWALDRDGSPPTDPAAAAVLLPFGGHKGYGLALLVDLLCAALTGSPIAREHIEAAPPGERPGQSFCFLALDPAAFGPAGAFAAKVRRLIADAHATPAAEGAAEVLLPGELEARAQQRRSREGIPLYQEDWSAMTEGLARAGLDVADLAARYGPHPAATAPAR